MQARAKKYYIFVVSNKSDAKQILTASPSENWTSPTTWIKTDVYVWRYVLMPEMNERMNDTLNALGHVVVEYQRDVFNVNTSARHVRSNENIFTATF